MNEDELKRYIDCINMAVDYNDLLNLLSINRTIFVDFYKNYKYQLPEGTKIRLELINKGKTVDINYRYIISVYLKELSKMKNIGLLYDFEVIRDIKNTEIYKRYQLSNDEIISNAKAAGIEITTIEEMENEVRVRELKELNIKNPIERERLMNLIINKELFKDIKFSHLAYLLKRAGIILS